MVLQRINHGVHWYPLPFVVSFSAYIDYSMCMEVRMDMQGMPMSEMHNTFWRENQIVVSFHTATPLISSSGVNQGDLILKELDLELQRRKLNVFLRENGLNYT